jgi:hypothetical protein
MGNRLHSSYFAPNNFSLFPTIKSAFKGRRFQDNEDTQKKCYDGTESYSTTGAPKIFPTVATSLG